MNRRDLLKAVVAAPLTLVLPTPKPASRIMCGGCHGGKTTRTVGNRGGKCVRAYEQVVIYGPDLYYRNPFRTLS